MSSVSKSFVAYGSIKEQIISGGYPAGAKLVIARIAAEQNMSTIPVREAIRMLEAEGLVHFNHNLGAQVASVDMDRVAEMGQYEYILESAATALAAPRIHAASIQALKDLNSRLLECVCESEIDMFASLSQRFHQMICSSCPNSFLLERLTESWAKGVSSHNVSAANIEYRGRAIVEEHESLIALIESHADYDSIYKANRAHRERLPMIPPHVSQTVHTR